MKKHSILLWILTIVTASQGQIPNGYYDEAQGKKGYALKTALHIIIKNHNDRGYRALWDAYKKGDTDPVDGYVWDMYSENPNGTDPYNFTHDEDKCGNYRNEGDCYNREHLFPQSIFSKKSPMRNDFHHVIPTDGKVNGQRGSYPFGEVGTVNWTSKNGSKRGNSVSEGYTGVVFEPIDEYKGDIARCLLYFATRYEGGFGSWRHAMINSTNDQVFADWFIKVLLKWHKLDKVSQKEINRNNAGYDYQGNRNPFIDHPEYVSCIWENECKGNTGIVTQLDNATTKQIAVYLKNDNNLLYLDTDGSYYFQILSMSGNTIKDGIGKERTEIDMSTIIAGIYLVKIISQKSTRVIRIIKGTSNSSVSVSN